MTRTNKAGECAGGRSTPMGEHVRHYWIVIATILSVLVLGHAQVMAQSHRPDRRASLQPTAERHPDIAGAYFRPHGAAAWCDGTTRAPAIQPPVYDGVTQIRLWPEHVLIVNQFTTSRTIPVNSGDHRPATPRATWRTATLVIESEVLRQFRFVLRPPDDHNDGVRVVEKYTPFDSETLDYEFVVHDIATAERWAIRFPLRRIEAPPSTAMTAHRYWCSND